MSDQDERFFVLAPTGRDGSLTCSLLSQAGISCEECSSLPKMIARAERGAAGLLIAEEALTGDGLSYLRDFLTKQEAWSDIPVLLFTGQSATAGPRVPITNLLGPLGNVALLDRPLRPITMVSAARGALRGRRRQYAAREEMAEQQRAVRQRDQFLAMLGHELRNPLGAILMAIEVTDRTGDDLKKHSSVIRRQSRHLGRLVDDLLDVSRVTSGKISIQRAPVTLNDLIQRCLMAMDASIKEQQLDVRFRLPDDPVMVEGDDVRLEQVIVNLLTNAIKYTPAGGEIEISLTVENDRAVIRFRDSGMGIAADTLPHIFDLFAQAQCTLDRSKGGMGIGLTLVRTLLALHDGTIDATSPGLGKGSVFTVRLPLLAPAKVRREKIVPAAPKVQHAFRILLVEDNEDSREMLQLLLEHLGHWVEVAGDGRAGVELALKNRPEVMLVDIGLPLQDGYSVARQIRSALGSKIYLVALTGYGQPDDRRRALEAGFDMHFTKPLDPSAIQTLLGQAKLVSHYRSTSVNEPSPWP